jgi:thiol-disulfide isomerase/thioredoxin
MKRRTALYGGVAAAAGLAGAGAAWWRNQAHGIGEGLPTAAGPGVDAAQFWDLTFETPEGKALPMRSFRGKPLLVNFWATWCPPCVEELPLLDSFYTAQRGRLQMVGLAVDQPSAVRKWLQAKPLGFSVVMAGLSGTELSKSLGNTAGSLPFTAVFNAVGEVMYRKIGKVTPEELFLWVK